MQGQETKSETVTRGLGKEVLSVAAPHAHHSELRTCAQAIRPRKKCVKSGRRLSTHVQQFGQRELSAVVSTVAQPGSFPC